eukprot:TRINITY_DN6863_c0_g2_i1.p1 TRINITY_DN6863_c0_g2~~TRINITY_DN6863_c0_g2_i1.p1  ORF type:complete len:146 (+),score=17.21 TRINITY_DN6863_c0_g2_i1:311-748(+)
MDQENVYDMWTHRAIKAKRSFQQASSTSPSSSCQSAMRAKPSHPITLGVGPQSKRKTLGDLVEVAYHKNNSMKKAAEAADEQAPSLRKTILQRSLWNRLRCTFFAPDCDTNSLAEAPMGISVAQASKYVKSGGVPRPNDGRCGGM